MVLPAYNEQARLPSTLESWCAYLDAQPYGWEIVVADDGSSDRTSEVAVDAARTRPAIRVVRLEHNRGKGGAVRHGVLSATGRVVLVADADHNVPAAFVGPALELIDSGADVASGQRSLRRYAREERSVRRLAAGLAVQASRRVLRLTSVRDTQCGFKAFRRDAAREIFRRARIDSFAYDIEVLYLARRFRYRVVPFPVEMSFKEGSTFDVRKHLPRFLRDIFRVRLNALRGVYD